MFPFDSDEPFKNLEWHQLVLAVLKAPIVLVMKLTVPVVDRELPREGWVRPAMTVHMFFLPSLLAAFVLMQDGIPDWMIQWNIIMYVLVVCAIVGAGLAYWLWESTREAEERGDDSPPKYHRYLGLVGFVLALVWIYATAREIVNAVLAFGVVFEVGTLVLGVTVLAIGIGMQDLVTCMGIARAGLPAMAASSCVGASMMNIMLGIGLSGLIGVTLSPYETQLYVSLQLIICILFMLISIVLALSVMWGGGFEGGQVFGASLLGLYALFVIVSLVVGMLSDQALKAV